MRSEKLPWSAVSSFMSSELGIHHENGGTHKWLDTRLQKSTKQTKTKTTGQNKRVKEIKKMEGNRWVASQQALYL